MPVTADQIESYQGDPKIAFGSSSVPGGTGVVWDLGVSDAAWARFAQNKLQVARDNLAQLKRKQLLADAALQKELDLGNYKVIPEDVPLFNKEWQKLRDIIKEPGVVAGWQSNDPLNPGWQKLQKQLDYLKQFSSMSTQQGTHADVTFNDVSGNPDKYVDGFGEVNKYRAVGDPYKRKDMVLEPKPNISLDFPAYVAKLKTSITPTQKVTSRMVNGRYEDTTETMYDADKIDAATKIDYQTNKKFKAEADEAFGDLVKTNPEMAAALGSPQRYASATAYDMLNGGNKVTVKNPFFPPGTASITTVPHEEEFAFNVSDVSGVKEKRAEINQKIDALNTKTKKTDDDRKEIVKLQEELKKVNPKTTLVYGVGGGYKIGAKSENPRGINLFVKRAHLIGSDTNQKQILNQDDIGANAWTVDVIGRTNVYKLPNGRYLYTQKGETRNLPIEDVVLVNSDAGGLYSAPQTIAIPYEDISTQLKNAKILFDENESQLQTNQQPKQKTYKGLDAQGNPIFE